MSGSNVCRNTVACNIIFESNMLCFKPQNVYCLFLYFSVVTHFTCYLNIIEYNFRAINPAKLTAMKPQKSTMKIIEYKFRVINPAKLTTMKSQNPQWKSQNHIFFLCLAIKMRWIYKEGLHIFLNICSFSYLNFYFHLFNSV